MANYDIRNILSQQQSNSQSQKTESARSNSPSSKSGSSAASQPVAKQPVTAAATSSPLPWFNMTPVTSNAYDLVYSTVDVSHNPEAQATIDRYYNAKNNLYQSITQKRHDAGLQELSEAKKKDAQKLLEVAANSPDPSVGERVGRTVLGAVEGSVGDTVGAFANFYEGGVRGAGAQRERELADLRQQQERAMKAVQASLEKYNGDMDNVNVQAAQRTLKDVEDQIKIYEGIDDSSLYDFANDVYYKAADTIKGKSQENIERAKQGLGAGGQFAVDLGVAATQMGLDALTMKGLGMGGVRGAKAAGGLFKYMRGATNVLPAMAVHSFGSGALQARAAGASYERQALFGLATAMKEVMTEKIGDMPKLAGGGLTDKIVNRALSRFIDSPVARTAVRAVIGFGDEAFEEFIGGIVEPALESIYNDKSIRENYSDMKISDILYDALVGGVLGALGTGRASVNGSFAADDARIRIQNEAQANIAKQLPTEKSSSTRSKAEAIAKVLSGEELTPAEQRQLDRSPVAQSVLEEMQKHGADTGNPLYNTQTKRQDEKLAQVAAKSTDSDFAAYSDGDLIKIARAAKTAKDDGLYQRVVSEFERRSAEREASFAPEQRIDTTEDQAELAARLNPQLREQGDRNERPVPMETSQYDENGQPIPDYYQPEQAPVPEEAPPEFVPGGLTDEQRALVEQEADQQQATEPEQPVPQPAPEQKKPVGPTVSKDAVLTVDDFISKNTGKSTQEYIDAFHEAAAENPELIEHLLSYPTNYFEEGRTKLGKALKALKNEYENQQNSGTIGVSNTEEANNGRENRGTSAERRFDLVGGRSDRALQERRVEPGAEANDARAAAEGNRENERFYSDAGGTGQPEIQGKVISESDYSDEQKDFAESAKEDGFESCRIVDGDSFVHNGVEVKGMTGKDGSLAIANLTPEFRRQIKDHECIHLWSLAIPVEERFEKLSGIIRNIVGQEKFISLFDTYSSNLEDTYGDKEKTLFYSVVMQEILGDMNGGLYRFGADAGDYRAEAKKAIKDAGLMDGFLEARKTGNVQGDSSSYFASAKGIENAIRKAASGDVKNLSTQELRFVLDYALDRASPETKGDPVADRAADVILNAADETGKNAQPKNWLYDTGYTGNTVGSLNSAQSGSLVSTIQNVLNELDRRGVSITEAPDSTVSNYANKFGVDEIESGQNARTREEMTIEERHAEDNAGQTEFQAEEEYRKGKMRKDVDALRKAGESQAKGEKLQKDANFNKNVPVPKSEKTTWTVNGKQVEVSGWVTPSEVDSKALKQAEEAVKAKGQKAEIEDRIRLLDARAEYLRKVAEQTRKARADFYGSEDVEQRKADLGYMADNINEQLEQLDADMGYMSDELDNLLENNPSDPRALSLAQAIDEAQHQADSLRTQLDSLRDEYRHLKNGDSDVAREVRKQIDAITTELQDLYRRLGGVSKRAAKADWGSTKRTLFQAEVSGELDKNFWSYLSGDVSFSKPGDADILSGETYTAAEKKQAAKEATDFRKKLDNIVNGKGELFKAVTEADNAPLHDDLDNPKAKLTKEQREKAAQRVGSKPTVKPVTPEVADAMLHLQEDVKGILESDAPLRHVLNLAESIRSYGDERHKMNWLTKNGIAEAAQELQDIFDDKNMDNDVKARNMAEATTRLLQMVSTRVDRAESNRARGLSLEQSIAENARQQKEAKTKLSKFGQKAKNWTESMQLNPTTAFKMADGFNKQKNGTGYWIAHQIENAVAKEQMLTASVHGKYNALKGIEGVDDFVSGKSMAAVEVPGVGQITEQQAVEFIKMVNTLYHQRVGMDRRLDTIKGFAFIDKSGKEVTVNRKAFKSGEMSNFAEDVSRLAVDMERKLNPAAKKYLEITNEILDDLGTQVSSAMQRTLGVGMTQYHKGGYYPVKYQSQGDKKAPGSSKPAGLFDQFTERTKTTGGLIRIESAADTVDSYIRNAVYAASYGELADTLEFLNTPALGLNGLSNAAGEAFGSDFKRMFNNYVNDVAGIKAKDATGSSELLHSARQLLQQGALRFSVSVPIKQVASYWNAAGVVSPEALMQAYRFKLFKDKGYGKNNLQLQYRAVGGIDPTLSEMLNNQGFLTELKKRSGIVNAWDKAISTMDYRTVDDLYHACIIDAKSAFPSIDQNSKQFADIVNSLFQEAVLSTQPTFNANARSEYQRTSNEWIRMAGMFRTQQTQNFNRAVTALGEYNAAKGTILEASAKKQLRQTLTGQLAAAAEFGLLSIVAEMARHKLKPYKKDEDEQTEGNNLSLKKIGTRWGLNTLESLAGNLWIGLGGADQLVKGMVDAIMHDTSDESGEYRGINLGPITSAASAFKNLQSVISTVVKAWEEKDLRQLDINALRYAATNTAQLFGIPANNVVNFVDSALTYVLDGVSEITGEKKGNRADYDSVIKMVNKAMKGELTVESAKHQANLAFNSGDTENLLYNIGILEAQGRIKAEKEGKDDPHSGADYLAGRLLGSTDEQKAATRAAEVEQYGRELTSKERIANYLVGDGLSDKQIDEAIGEYVTSGGYNVLYNALRAQGFSPKNAVNELYKSDNKTGMQTEILSDDSVKDLLAGKVNPGNGTDNDIPALEQRNLDQYVDYATGLKVFIETKNYDELDKLVFGYSKLDKNTQAVLAAKDSNLMHMIEVSKLGITSSDYYTVKEAEKQAQIDLDLSSKEGSPNKMVALSISGLPKNKQEALMQSEWLGISKTAKVCYDALSQYGYSIGDVGKWLLSTDFSWDKSNGTISNIEAAQGLRHLEGLTDAQRRAIYETLKPQLTNPHKINDWGKYSYDSEIAYIDKNGYTVGKWN